ncbi:hypothetical protein L210DRAFT_3516516 [Boletus edulis BED1]|uniref:Uncharacterized protein n=1 Tax=Boletus edulis BED1 TaxID=1328754 RepID=A0AAD4C9E8_BOLED|nr:hypothetical protein L210DRAFT_3516516 [Boletus edulis BED1]
MWTRYSRQSPLLKIRFITYLPVELFCELVCNSPRGLSTAHPPWAIIVFMAGEHPDAISHLNDLIATTRPCATCYHAANIATDVFLETRRWNVMTTRVQCIRSRARTQMQGDVGPPLFAISLASFFLDSYFGRKSLQDCTHHQTLLNNVSRASKTLVSQLRTHPSMVIRRCFNLQSPIPLLREWEKATLFVVPRFTTYVALCERLETIDRITDAVECFYDMTSESGGDVNP